MPIWIALVVFASIGVTALLIGVLWRMNLASLRNASSAAAVPAVDDEDADD